MAWPLCRPAERTKARRDQRHDPAGHARRPGCSPGLRGRSQGGWSPATEGQEGGSPMLQDQVDRVARIDTDQVVVSLAALMLYSICHQPASRDVAGRVQAGLAVVLRQVDGDRDHVVVELGGATDRGLERRDAVPGRGRRRRPSRRWRSRMRCRPGVRNRRNALPDARPGRTARSPGSCRRGPSRSARSRTSGCRHRGSCTPPSGRCRRPGHCRCRDRPRWRTGSRRRRGFVRVDARVGVDPVEAGREPGASVTQRSWAGSLAQSSLLASVEFCGVPKLPLMSPRVLVPGS